jgi:uncharacterized membrane protein
MRIWIAVGAVALLVVAGLVAPTLTGDVINTIGFFGIFVSLYMLWRAVRRGAWGAFAICAAVSMSMFVGGAALIPDDVRARRDADHAARGAALDARLAESDREEERRQRRLAARERRERERSEQSSESLARRQMERMQGQLGDPIGPILEQMSMPAQRSQSGEDRTFTYTFRDGSRLILVARPQGDGQGLTLYYVDVQE